MHIPTTLQDPRQVEESSMPTVATGVGGGSLQNPDVEEEEA